VERVYGTAKAQAVAASRNQSFMEARRSRAEPGETTSLRRSLSEIFGYRAGVSAEIVIGGLEPDQSFVAPLQCWGRATAKRGLAEA